MNKKKSSSLFIFFILLFFANTDSNAQVVETVPSNFLNKKMSCSKEQSQEEIKSQSLLVDEELVDEELLFTLPILPLQGETKIISFDSLGTFHDKKPRIIFEPTFFGNQGCVNLAPGSRLVFSGDGIIEVRDGVTFDLSTAELVLEKGATLQVVPNGTVTFVNQNIVEKSPVFNKETDNNSIIDQETTNLSQEDNNIKDPGTVIVRKGGKILLDKPSHIIFGSHPIDTITLKAEFGGQFIVADKDACVSFYKGTFDIFFSNFSIFHILNGTVALNSCRGAAGSATFKKWHFQTGAMLEVTNDEQSLGTLLLAQNNAVLNRSAIDFDNQNSFTSGTGNLQFVLFDNNGVKVVNSIVKMQPHRFKQKGSILDLFVTLACMDQPGTKSAVHIVKFVESGTIKHDNMHISGGRAVLNPVGDGSISLLRSGDHKLVYDSDKPSGMLNVIRGCDVHNRLFFIKDGKRHG